MPPPNGEYDQNLLDEAPKATRAQRQEGYNVDLLDERPARRSPSMRSPSTPAPNALPVTPGVAESGSREKFAPVGAPNAAHTSAPRRSFWKTRNGIITLAVIALVILGAVIGGAVGGTVGKKNNNKSVTGESTSSQSVSPSSIPPPTATSSQTQQIGQGQGGGIGGAISTEFGPGAFRPTTTSQPSPEQTASSIVGIAVNSD